MEREELIPHLFRTEYRKIVSVLSKAFGLEYIEIAEDIVSDTFLAATETWGRNGLPENPVAWLYAVSKNKARDFLKRKEIFHQKVTPEVRPENEAIAETEIDLSGKNINDSQLQMMFALCHPSIPVESQIGLSLSILCGFGANEIADAFLTDREVIYKRLNRAKEKLRTENIKVEMPSGSEIDKRLETVLTTLYLLFSEGYYSASNNTSLRKELCLEAMRLNRMLIDHEQTDTPAVNALLSLMCFHASRFEARTSHNGEFVIYEEQDETLWNVELKERGVHYLNRASTGKKVTRYHIEAAIAYWHTQKKDTQEKWESILQLYNRLLQFEYSPVAALNRTYALSKANGKEEAIIEAEKLNLNGNRLYHCLLANLYEQVDHEKAIGHWKTALSLTKTISDRSFIQQKIDALAGNV